jgi:hypothetical protein
MGDESWMLSRSEIANMTAEEALVLFERLAREIMNGSSTS